MARRGGGERAGWGEAVYSMYLGRLLTGLATRGIGSGLKLRISRPLYEVEARYRASTRREARPDKNIGQAQGSINK